MNGLASFFLPIAISLDTKKAGEKARDCTKDRGHFNAFAIFQQFSECWRALRHCCDCERYWLCGACVPCVDHHCPKCICGDLCIGGSVDIGLHVTRFFLARLV